MNIYQVSTGCYSDFSHTILVNEKSYSEEEFRGLCKKVCESMFRKDDYSANEEELVEKLIRDYGFKRPEITSCHFWDYSYDDDSFS